MEFKKPFDDIVENLRHFRAIQFLRPLAGDFLDLFEVCSPRLSIVTGRETQFKFMTSPVAELVYCFPRKFVLSVINSST